MKKNLTILLLLIANNILFAQSKNLSKIEETFLHPPVAAKPWVFWYWMHGAVSKTGITADLAAMKKVGIGGAYLMTIKDTTSAIDFQPTARQLTPKWWALVKFAMQEAKRLKMKLGMHVSDGFALAGGPWIKPEMSMQKLVWTKTFISDGSQKIILTKPEIKEYYYKDIAVYAYPVNYKVENQTPEIKTNNGADVQFLIDKNNKQTFKCDTSCWIQFSYQEQFELRQIKIIKQINAYQSNRFIIQSSDNGINFKTVDTLQPPRHGWQDADEDYTHSIKPTTAKYFRLLWNKDGTVLGSEDLEAAKWKPALRVQGIYFSNEPVINNYEAKNGSIWRVANETTNDQIADKDAVPLNKIIDLSKNMDTAGNISWVKPSGKWVIVRIGHTSTGATNATGGAAKGLECDKFSSNATKLQYDNWFGAAFKKTDEALAKKVLKIFHVDSWECGSQNWSSNFANEFKKRRGYDLMPYLIVMTGVPIESAKKSEDVLHDVRTTIAELVNNIFYGTLKNLAHEKGCQFSAESIAPTFVSDGLLHYKNVDIPMGEFWNNSPTHDKPNDMLDAISGAHIYGKNIIQAEAFTTLRMDWNEHPGNLKDLGDRNFALGANKLVLHVFTHNPWTNKKPGMTLDGVGLFYQRDQTWFKQSKAWIEYLTRCQALLQLGKPVVDIGVFTGEEIPRRAVLPDRLVNILPGIFGKEKVNEEAIRLQNKNQPMRQKPDGVSHAANISVAENWINPLNGYAYDSFNPDALWQMTVKNGAVVLPSGASYKLLIIPANMKLNPANRISEKSLNKIKELVQNGATVLLDKIYIKQMNLKLNFENTIAKFGKGRFVLTPYLENDFSKLGVEKDFEIENSESNSIAYQHRKLMNSEIYFISNQLGISQEKVEIKVFKRSNQYILINPITTISTSPKIIGLHKISITLNPNESLFLLSNESLKNEYRKDYFAMPYQKNEIIVENNWTEKFENLNNLTLENQPLQSWTENSLANIKYYSGTVNYSNTFYFNEKKFKNVNIKFDSIFNLATVKINGHDCGTLWTYPYELNITKAIKQGNNKIEIEVANTWHNKLIGDSFLPKEKQTTFTTAPFRLKDKPLEPAGIVGQVKITTIY